MCKHNPKAQVSIRAPCCKKWFDCTQCHVEVENHELKRTYEIIFACKKCKKVFKKDMREFEEQDEYCPHCDNHFALPPSETTGKLVVSLEGTQDMIRDDREKARNKETLEHMGAKLSDNSSSSSSTVFSTIDYK